MNINKYIDITLLKSNTSFEDVDKLAAIAIKKGYRSVCIPPSYVGKIKNKYGKNLRISTVVGFPLGNIPLQIKIEEIRKYITDGADDLDIVLNIGAIKSGEWDIIRDEIYSFAGHSRFWNATIKLIIEISYLEENDVARICAIVNNTPNIHCVKTSTGFGKRDTTVEDIKIIRKYLHESKMVKASGGVRKKKLAIEMIEAGANIIGTSTIFDE